MTPENTMTDEKAIQTIQDKPVPAALLADIAKAKMPEPEHYLELLSQFCMGVVICGKAGTDRKFERIDCNAISSGVEAIFQDKQNGQKYRVTIEPIR